MDGAGADDSVLLGSYCYTYNLATSILEKTDGQLSLFSKLEDAAGDSKENNIDHIWIADVKVGNYNHDSSALTSKAVEQEQFFAVTCYEDTERDKINIWYNISVLSKRGDGGYLAMEEGVIGQGDMRYGGFCFVSICLPDVDDDSYKLKFLESYVIYTDPTVYAVLQSAPYFQDVQDSTGYLSGGATSYGTTKSSSHSVTAGVTASLGVYTSAETSLAVAAEVEVEASASMSFEYQHGWDKTTNITYSGNAGDDYVVLYTQPYVCFKYAMYDPQIKKTTDMLVSVPLSASTSLLTVDKYDTISAATDGLEAIRGNVLLSIPGELATYKSWPSGSIKQIGDTQMVTAAEGGVISVEYEATTSNEFSVSAGAEINTKVGSGAGAFGTDVKVGMTSSMGASAGYTYSSSNGYTYSGAVDCLPNGYDDYGYAFSWALGVGSAGLNDRSIMVVGYKVSDLSQPPRMPVNFHVSGMTSDSIMLEWEKTSGVTRYRINTVDTRWQQILRRGRRPDHRQSAYLRKCG